jgi:putative tricarboxylic transport membrane protein
VTVIWIESSARKRESMSNDIKAPSKLNNSELWGGLIGLALGVFVIWSGIKLKIVSINDPGSGFVLFYTGLLMCVFAATIIVADLGSRWKARWSKPLLTSAFALICSDPFRRSLRAFVARIRSCALVADDPAGSSGPARRGGFKRSPDPVALALEIG